MAMPTARIARSGHLQRPRCADAVLPFLAPSIRLPKKVPGVSAAQFSTSPALQKRDNNRNRGLSIFRATGTRKRQTLSVKKHLDDLPAPEKPNAPVHGDPNHGLYGFFRDKKLLRTPVEDNQKGRAWTVPELRARSWNDLHSLWWLCVKERNRLATALIELDRLKLKSGRAENKQRDEVVQETMKAILETLVERENAWAKARQLAETDDGLIVEKDANGEITQVYPPEDEPYETDEAYEEEVAEVAQEVVAQDAVNQDPNTPTQQGKDSPNSASLNTKEIPAVLTEKARPKSEQTL